MRRFLFLSLFVFFSFASQFGAAQVTPPPLWLSATSFGGTGADMGASVKTDSSDNHYFCGYFSSTANFTTKMVTSVGAKDIYVAATGAAGNLSWLIQTGGPGDDVCTSIDLDSKRNVYVTGYFTDRATFGSSDGKGTVVTGLGESLFVAKYSSSGVLMWVNKGTATSAGLMNRGHGIAVEPKTETVYVAGFGQTDITLSSSDSVSYFVPGAWTWHMLLLKYDSAGNFKWADVNQADPNSVADGLAVDADSNVYVTGWMESTTTFASRDGRAQTIQGFSEPVQSYPDYPGDAFLCKYDRDGYLKWVNHIGGYKGNGRSVATSSNGNVTVTGLIGNIGYGSPQQAVTVATSQGEATKSLGTGHHTDPYNADVFIATYDRNGVLLRARRVGDIGHDVGTSVAYFGSDLHVAGTFEGTLSADGKPLLARQDHGIFVLKYGIAGVDWAQTAAVAAGPDTEVNPRISLSPTESVYVSGTFMGTASFGGKALQSSGAEDIFFASIAAPAPTCTPGTNSGVRICGPSNNSTVVYPVTIDFNSTPSSGAHIVRFRVYDNDRKLFDGAENQAGMSLTSANLRNGFHNVVINAWDTTGKRFQNRVMFTVVGDGFAETCMLPSSPGINFCTPPLGAILGRTYPISASALGTSKISAMRVYVDGEAQQTVYSNRLSTTASTNKQGTHVVSIVAWDIAGHAFKNTRTINSAYSYGWVFCSTSSNCLPGFDSAIAPFPNAYLDNAFTIKAAVLKNPLPLTTIKAYLDDRLIATSHGQSMNQQVLNMPAGTHILTLQAWDTAGSLYRVRYNINVNLDH
jgi:Beta-propeller repeat